jgi:hypothetical protein
MIIEQEYTDRVHEGRTVDAEFLLDHVLVRNMDIDSQGVVSTVRVTFDNDLSREVYMHGRPEAERLRIVEAILDRSRDLPYDPATARGSMLLDANFGPRSIPIYGVDLGLGPRRISSSFRLDGTILFRVMVPNPRPGGLDLAYNYDCYPPQVAVATPAAAPAPGGKGSPGAAAQD